MNLRQQIINEKTEAVAKRFGVAADEAFLRLAQSLVVGQGLHSFDPDDIVDGGQDKQIDVVTIVEEDDAADVYILQTKNTRSFSSNALIQLHNGLRWIFRFRYSGDTIPISSLLYASGRVSDAAIGNLGVGVRPSTVIRLTIDC